MPLTSLPMIQQEMIRYGMSIYCALGIIGNVCNCIMFTRSNYRHTANSLYLNFFSISAIIYLIWSTAPHFYSLNYVDAQTQSLFYCKIRLFVGHSLGQYLRFCIVLACIDRFLVTRIDVRLRSFHSIAIAKKFLLIMTVVCPLFAIHLPIFMEIRNNVCSQFGVYKLAYATYQFIVVGVVPPVLMIVFSILTVVSLQHRHNGQVRAKQRDRHLLKMVIVEVILNVIVSIPYSINLLYGALTHLTSKNARRLEIESFITFLTTFSIYLISITPFYLFVFTSKSFRKNFIALAVSFWYKYILRQAHVAPVTEHRITPNCTSNAI